MTHGQSGGFDLAGFFRDPRVKTTLYWLGIVGIWGLILLAALVLVFARGLPNISRLDELKGEPTIAYLDRSGAQIAIRGEQKTDMVRLDDLPPYVPKAFIVTEDQWYYWHPGFNPWGILRSQIYNIRHRGEGLPLRGGSTITQQVARNLFLSRDQNMRRKIQELILAVELEIRYSKKDILTLYLNRMDFGGGATGIEAASERYFGRPASQLTVGETALLAGVLKGTDRYSPVSNRARAQQRASDILNNMVRHKVITAQERDEAFKTPVQVSQDPANQRAGYFIDWIDDQVRSAIGGEPTEDLVVQTTLDLPLQTAAEGVIRQALIDNSKSRVTQAALLSIDGEGRVRAYVGGPDYYDSPFDRIAKGRRQPGSSFKPFVYLAAMEAGKTPNMIEVDEPINIDGWTPSNYEPGNEGPMPLQRALAHSVNTIAAKLTQEVGVPRVIDVARRLGITTPIPAVPSIALGTAEVSPLEMAQAYAAFSNGGYKVKAYGVETIRTKAGKVIYDHSRALPDKVQVIGTPALQYMNQMMRDVVRAGGTGAGAAIAGYDIAGKTGTTSDYHDAWFDGFTGGFVTVVWMAGPEGKNMARGVTGGGAPARAWKAYMTQALPRLQKQDIPGGIIEPPPPPETGGGLIDAIGDMISSVTGGGFGTPGPAPVTPPPNPVQAQPPFQPRPPPPALPPAGPPVRQAPAPNELPY